MCLRAPGLRFGFCWSNILQRCYLRHLGPTIKLDLVEPAFEKYSYFQKFRWSRAGASRWWNVCFQSTIITKMLFLQISIRFLSKLRLIVYSCRETPISTQIGMGLDAEHDDEGRVITTEFNNFYLVNVYVSPATFITSFLLLHSILWSYLSCVQAWPWWDDEIKPINLNLLFWYKSKFNHNATCPFLWDPALNPVLDVQTPNAGEGLKRLSYRVRSSCILVTLVFWCQVSSGTGTCCVCKWQVFQNI